MAPTTSDWQNAHLKEAAVAYALQQGCGPHCVVSDARVQRVARALNLSGEDGEPGAVDLIKWLRDAKLRPTVDGDVAGGMKGKSAAWMPGAVSGAGAGAGMKEVDGAGGDAGGPRAGTEGAVVDPLRDLLCAESDVLSEAEKEGMAAMLESAGAVVLTRAQRVALAVALRGSGMAGRREIALGLLRLISGGGIDAVTGDGWEVSDTSVVLRPGWHWAHEEMIRKLPGGRRRVLGKSMLVVRDVGGVVERVIFYARAHGRERAASWGTPGARVLRVRRLVPVRVFAREFVSQQCALLYSLVTNSGVRGMDWAALFDKTKQDVSHLQAKLAGKLGGKYGFGGLRGKTNQRKKSDQLAVISDQDAGGGRLE